MRIKKTDKNGTIHDLPVQLANISELNKIKPVTTKDKNEYLKILNKFKVLNSNLTEKEKKKIVSELNVMNFNEAEIEDQFDTLKAINKYNSLVNKKRIQLENEIRAGKNVKINDAILKNIEGYELEIPKEVRRKLKITEKVIKLVKKNKKVTENRIKFYSGQNYDFVIKDGFNKPYFLSYNEIQKIRKEGNVVEYLLNNINVSLNDLYEKDKSKYLKSDPKKWKQKQKVYSKIQKVINHNLQVSTNKKYDKKLVTRGENRKIVKSDGEYPLLMNIFDELIDLYIP